MTWQAQGAARDARAEAAGNSSPPRGADLSQRIVDRRSVSKDTVGQNGSGGSPAMRPVAFSE